MVHVRLVVHGKLIGNMDRKSPFIKNINVYIIDKQNKKAKNGQVVCEYKKVENYCPTSFEI